MSQHSSSGSELEGGDVDAFTAVLVVLLGCKNIRCTEQQIRNGKCPKTARTHTMKAVIAEATMEIRNITAVSRRQEHNATAYRAFRWRPHAPTPPDRLAFSARAEK